MKYWSTNLWGQHNPAVLQRLVGLSDGDGEDGLTDGDDRLDTKTVRNIIKLGVISRWGCWLCLKVILSVFSPGATSYPQYARLQSEHNFAEFYTFFVSFITFLIKTQYHTFTLGSESRREMGLKLTIISSSSSFSTSPYSSSNLSLLSCSSLAKWISGLAQGFELNRKPSNCEVLGKLQKKNLKSIKFHTGMGAFLHCISPVLKFWIYFFFYFLFAAFLAAGKVDGDIMNIKQQNLIFKKGLKVWISISNLIFLI